MAEKQLHTFIDATKESFCFLFSELDCYKLTSGRCTFELSEEEYKELSLKQSSSPSYYENRVGYCRELFEMMKDETHALSHLRSSGIRAYKHSCGHLSFNDGQHRACIAKKNNITNLTVDVLGDNGEHLCDSCYQEQQNAQKKKKFWERFKKPKKDDFSTGPVYVTNDRL